MLESLGKWEIRTDPQSPRGYQLARMEPEPEDLETYAGDFITRHVLEHDTVFFEG